MRYLPALLLACNLACDLVAVKDAGASDTQPFALLPAGTYRYTAADTGAANTGARASRSWLFRKSGSVVIGAELMSGRSRGLALGCFRGQAEGDRIVYVTQVAPPYDPASRWESGLVIDLAAGVSLDQPPTAAEQAALETCIRVFWR